MVRLLTAAAFCFCLGSVVLAQDAVPGEILQRTKLIKGPIEEGTAFSIDYLGKLYLVTARHVVAGLPIGKAVLQVWLSDKWEDMKIVKTLFPASADVDIAVLETEQRVAQPFSIAVPRQDEGVTLGQQVWFLGYPFGDVALTTRFSDQQILPFIKRGTMSAIDSSKTNAVVLYIDGFNNRGFSGGPIIFWSFSKHTYRILGVVHGYRNDRAEEVLLNGQKIDSNILYNSGILIGYDIKHAIEAIEHDQK